MGAGAGMAGGEPVGETSVICRGIARQSAAPAGRVDTRQPERYGERACMARACRPAETNTEGD